MNIKNTILSIFHFLDPKKELHAGLSFNGDAYHYILVSIKQDKLGRILYTKTGHKSSMHIPFGGPVHFDMDKTPVLYFCEDIGDVEPEQWIDTNETRVIPSGLSSNEVVNEWGTDEKLLYSVTCSKKLYDKLLDEFSQNNILISSLSVPFCDLARLYTGYGLTAPYVLWKVESNCSILGFVDNGKLKRISTFWAGQADVLEDNANVVKELKARVKAFCGDAVLYPLLVFGNDCKAVETSLAESGFTFVSPPTIPAVSLEYHEALAHALHQKADLDFASFEHTRFSHAIVQYRKRSLTILHIVATVALVLLFCTGIAKTVSVAAGSYLNEKAKPVRAQQIILQKEKIRLDSLTMIIAKKTTYLSQKSVLTYPVTEFQTAFPDNVWAEEITLFENNTSSWNCVFVVYAGASSVLPSLLANLAEIKGMSNVHMVYSEQSATVKSRTGEKAIRLRIESNWKNP
jgi:hypothetical protein